MTIKPLPSVLLCDEITLLTPDGSGYDSTYVSAVRVVRCSRVSEYSASIVRDSSELTVYYDCRVSSPSGLSFAAGMLIEYDDCRYEIISVQEHCTNTPHHIKMTAKRV